MKDGMLRVGLVGVGAMGSGHLSNYLRLMREGQKVQPCATCGPSRWSARTTRI